jgi:CHAT domain-containing protein
LSIPCDKSPASLDARAGRARMQPPSSAVAADLERRLRGPAAAPALRAPELRALLQRRDALVFTQVGTTVWRFHIVDGEIASHARLPETVLGLAESWVPSDARRAAELGDHLVPPAARAPSSRPLYIVSSGVLAEKPFAALRPGGRYLVETRATIRIPGLAVLRCQDGAPAAQEAVFIADSMGDLPGARQEAVALAAQRGQRAYLGWEATFDRLEAARDATLLHLAVHGDPSSHGNVLRLAGRDATAADIVEQRIAPRLAVLAGTATAASRDVEGWGALSSAFLAAGSQTVVATLSSVPDRASIEVMRRFYEAGGERRPAEALAAAQRELLDTGTAWIAFVVEGAGPACEPHRRDLSRL